MVSFRASPPASIVCVSIPASPSSRDILPRLVEMSTAAKSSDNQASNPIMFPVVTQFHTTDKEPT